VYLVDAMDRERFPEAKKELDVSDNTAVVVVVGVWRGLTLLVGGAILRDGRARLPPARPALDAAPRLRSQALLSNESLAATPFLILGNKIDIPRAASEGELRASLGLMETSGCVVPCRAAAVACCARSRLFGRRCCRG
jgi:GTPase SAR1 family protein